MSALVDFASAKVAVLRPQIGALSDTRELTAVEKKSISTSAFVSLVVILIAASMVGVIFLQALVAKSAFQKVELVQQRTNLIAERAFLMERTAQLESPQSLLSRATALGMVTPERPTYLRLSDKKLLDGRRNR
jgi:cell division protein FtsB